jgi:hypothetical protein
VVVLCGCCVVAWVWDYVCVYVYVCVCMCVCAVCVRACVQVHSLSEYRKAFNKNATESRSAILCNSSCYCCSLYQAVIKPIWSYGIELWGCASMQRSQSKILRFLANAPRYATNHTVHTDFNIPYVMTSSMKESINTTTHWKPITIHYYSLYYNL